MGSIHGPRDVSTGMTGMTTVDPFADTLTLAPPGGGGQILPTITEVAWSRAVEGLSAI